MSFQVVISFAVTFVFIAIWLLLYFKGPKNAVSNTLQFFVVNIILWSLSVAMFYESSSSAQMLFWAKMKYMIGGIIPAAFVMFVYSYPTGVLRVPAWFNLALFLPQIPLIYMIFFTPLIIDAVSIINGFKGFIYGRAIYVWDLYFMIYFLWGFIRLIHLYNQYSGPIRDTISYIIRGSLVGLILGGTTSIVMPWFGHFQFVWLGPVLMLTWLVYVLYAVFKHQFLAAQEFVKRSILYSVLITIVTVFYCLLIFAGEKMFQSMLGYKTFMASIIAATLIAVIFVPLRNWIRSLIDHCFFEGSYFDMIKENEYLRQEVANSEKLKSLATIFNRIVHEIKSPLTVLKGYSQFLPEKVNDKEFILKFAKILEHETNRMNQLVDHLNDYSKPVPLSARETNICQLIEETIEMLRNNLRHSKVNVTTDFKVAPPAGGCSLHIDPKQIRQALLNILVNAIESMPYGGDIFITVEEMDRFIHIRIKDTGHGIPKDDLAKIFNPFFTTKPNHAGLGLSVAQGIIESHLGRTRVKSEIGIGAEFTIELPLSA